jgi:Activator of Hsp90 ATPase homolog 1-like protein
MSFQDFTTTFSVDRQAEEVFAAINDVRGWWGEDVEGSNEKVGDEFTYRVKDIHYSKMKVVELIPNEKIVWLVLDNHLDFVEDQSEWVGTQITFDIVARSDQTQVRFAHLGLVPQYECFDICSNAWGSLMHGSLRNLITTGTGNPYRK